eukprot:3942557-Amphidinium_carterae.1
MAHNVHNTLVGGVAPKCVAICATTTQEKYMIAFMKGKNKGKQKANAKEKKETIPKVVKMENHQSHATLVDDKATHRQLATPT